MKRILPCLLTACALLAAPALHAQELQEKWTKDIYGNKVKVTNDNRELPKFRLIGSAYRMAILKDGGEANNAVLALVSRDDYAAYAQDGEFGPFIDIALEKRIDAIVFVILPSFKGHKTHAVFFRASKPAFYAAGGGKDHGATPDEVRASLQPLPEKLPLLASQADTLRLKAVNLVIDKGVRVKAYHVVYVGKAEIPWMFGDKGKAPAPAGSPAKQ